MIDIFILFKTDIYSKSAEHYPTPCLGIATTPPTFIENKKLQKFHPLPPHRLLKDSENYNPPLILNPYPPHLLGPEEYIVEGDNDHEDKNNHNKLIMLINFCYRCCFIYSYII